MGFAGADDTKRRWTGPFSSARVGATGGGGQLPIAQSGPFGDGGGERADESAAGAGGARRKFRLVAAVEEHQPDSAVLGRTSSQQIQLPDGHPGGRCLRRRWREWDLG